MSQLRLLRTLENSFGRPFLSIFIYFIFIFIKNVEVVSTNLHTYCSMHKFCTSYSLHLHTGCLNKIVTTLIKDTWRITVETMIDWLTEVYLYKTFTCLSLLYKMARRKCPKFVTVNDFKLSGYQENISRHYFKNNTIPYVVLVKL